MNNDLFTAVQEALAKQLRLPKEKILPESGITDDLGADSLDVLQLLMTIEEEMGITIPDEALAKFGTVADITAYLESRQKK